MPCLLISALLLNLLPFYIVSSPLSPSSFLISSSQSSHLLHYSSPSRRSLPFLPIPPNLTLIPCLPPPFAPSSLSLAPFPLPFLLLLSPVTSNQLYSLLIFFFSLPFCPLCILGILLPPYCSALPFLLSLSFTSFPSHFHSSFFLFRLFNSSSPPLSCFFFPFFLLYL
jgi:hypothetical protein